MKELTRIWTVELTEIIENNRKYIDTIVSDQNKQETAKYLTNKFNKLGFDNANITNVQDFVRDIDEVGKNPDGNQNDPLRSVAEFVDELLKKTIDMPGVSVCANFRDNSISIFVSRDEEEDYDEKF